MKKIEDLCEQYYKSEEVLDKDLMAILRCKNSSRKYPDHIYGQYASDLCELLKGMGYLEDKVWYLDISQQGKDILKKGWIIRDYAALKRKESWKEIREWLTLIIAILSLVIGFFFPRTDSSEAENKLVESSIANASPITDAISDCNNTTAETNENEQANKNCHQDYK